MRWQWQWTILIIQAFVCEGGHQATAEPRVNMHVDRIVSIVSSAAFSFIPRLCTYLYSVKRKLQQSVLWIEAVLISGVHWSTKRQNFTMIVEFNARIAFFSFKYSQQWKNTSGLVALQHIHMTLWKFDKVYAWNQRRSLLAEFFRRFLLNHFVSGSLI